MKLLGKNSISTVISWVFFLLFILTTFVFVYTLLGYAVCYYNQQTGSHFLQEIFQTGLKSDKSNDLINRKPENFFPVFSIREPFGKVHRVAEGLFIFSTFLHFLLKYTFSILFFFSVYKVFNGMSKEILFNTKVIKWLKRFSLINLVYAPLFIYNCMYNPIHNIYLNVFRDTDSFLIAIIALVSGMLVMFIIEFFKKGLELQKQTDLTI